MAKDSKKTQATNATTTDTQPAKVPTPNAVDHSLLTAAIASDTAKYTDLELKYRYEAIVRERKARKVQVPFLRGATVRVTNPKSRFHGKEGTVYLARRANCVVDFGGTTEPQTISVKHLAKVEG